MNFHQAVFELGPKMSNLLKVLNYNRVVTVFTLRTVSCRILACFLFICL